MRGCEPTRASVPRNHRRSRPREYSRNLFSMPTQPRQRIQPTAACVSGTAAATESGCVHIRVHVTRFLLRARE